MTIPKLKRITISSEQELRVWLASHTDQEDSVMLVTHTTNSHPAYVSREQVSDALAAHGWVAGRRYTLHGTLLGHVVSRPDA